MIGTEPTLLIVENEAMIAAEICASVEEAGYAVQIVPSSALALAVLRRLPIVGAILDFRVADGVTASLAKCLSVIKVPYVIVSGSPSREIAMAGIETDRVFSKPVNYARVIEHLQHRFGMPQAA